MKMSSHAHTQRHRNTKLLHLETQRSWYTKGIFSNTQYVRTNVYNNILKVHQPNNFIMLVRSPLEMINDQLPYKANNVAWISVANIYNEWTQTYPILCFVLNVTNGEQHTVLTIILESGLAIEWLSINHVKQQPPIRHSWSTQCMMKDLTIFQYISSQDHPTNDIPVHTLCCYVHKTN